MTQCVSTRCAQCVFINGKVVVICKIEYTSLQAMSHYPIQSCRSVLPITRIKCNETRVIENGDVLWWKKTRTIKRQQNYFCYALSGHRFYTTVLKSGGGKETFMYLRASGISNTCERLTSIADHHLHTSDNFNKVKTAD